MDTHRKLEQFLTFNRLCQPRHRRKPKWHKVERKSKVPGGAKLEGRGRSFRRVSGTRVEIYGVDSGLPWLLGRQPGPGVALGGTRGASEGPPESGL